MTIREIISLILVLTILLPPANCWAQMEQLQQMQQKQEQPSQPSTPTEQQKMEEQAKYYLQKIGPGGVPMEQLPAIKPAPPIPMPEPAKILTTAPRQPEEISVAERRAEENGLVLKQFGYSFFYKPPDTFLPVQGAVPVGPDYVIGPEDTVRLVLWGNVSGEYSVTVDRNGNIAIPKIGVVHVSGLDYRQLRQVMEKEFARQYTNFQLNVTLDNLRTINVFVVGQTRFPGTYAVSSLSTLVSALFAAGGPSKTGSMRNIQVRRGKKVVATFDMYDFLLRGDKSKDIRLQPEDVIFIPPIGPLAAIGSPRKDLVDLLDKAKSTQLDLLKPGKIIAQQTVAQQKVEQQKAEQQRLIQDAVKEASTVVGGPIKVPAIYELKDERTIMDLLGLAGRGGGHGV